MLGREAIDSLFPSDLPGAGSWEERYPQRELAPGAKVTRFGPSPTGFVHIGGVYTATIAKNVAIHSEGSYFVRIEDTDQSREVVGADQQFDRAFSYFGIESQETDENSSWGPYRQSQREQIYLSFARELLRQGRAYLCFASKDELAEIAAQQNAAKVPTGYYGRWATWRDAAEQDVLDRLAAADPYVVRFRAPGTAIRRVSYQDDIRGVIEQDDNRNDAVILKTSAVEPRLPTYHFAHAVDDHLMRVNEVIRGEEWISSVPLHHQLCDALGFERFRYAHIAPLMKLVGSSKRKLSKRKDPEASVDFYLEAGYPVPAVLYYLRGLANGRLAELPLPQALAEAIRLAECGIAGPLLDMAKLDDISRNHIADLDGGTVLDHVATWARQYDAPLAEVLAAEHDLARRAVDVERVGVDNPRKDLGRWSDFRPVYGFFFSGLFDLVTDPSDERFGGLAPTIVADVAADFAAGYTEHAAQPDWFEQIRTIAAKHGFAASMKEFKQNPSGYPGSLREVATVLRVALTGSTRSPDLHAVAMALGSAEVLRRVRAVAG
jgi:glutamyl-tRNA synthetase